MNIRPAKTEDMVQVQKLFSLRELSIATGEYLSVEQLLEYLDENFFLVAENDNEIVGAIFGEPLKNNGMMGWEFAVSEQFRNTGIGGKLADVFEANMRANNKTWVIGYAPEKSPATLKFYKQRGFHMGQTFVEVLKMIDEDK